MITRIATFLLSSAALLGSGNLQAEEYPYLQSRLGEGEELTGQSLQAVRFEIR